MPQSRDEFLSSLGGEQDAPQSRDDFLASLGPEPEAPGPLRSFAGSALQGLSSLAGFGRLGAESLATLPSFRGMRAVAPAFEATEQALTGTAEEVYPPEQRGQGGLLTEDVPAALGSMAAALPGLATGGAGAMLAFGAQNGVPLYYDVLESTGDDEAATWGLLFGGAVGQLERFGAEKYLSGIVSKLSKGTLGKAMKQAALGWAIGGPSEAATEMAQQGLSDLALEQLTDEDVDNWERMKAVVPPSLIVGGGAAILDSAIGRAQERKARPQAAQAAPGAQQAPVTKQTTQPTEPAPGAPVAPQEAPGPERVVGAAPTPGVETAAETQAVRATVPGPEPSAAVEEAADVQTQGEIATPAPGEAGVAAAAEETVPLPERLRGISEENAKGLYFRGINRSRKSGTATEESGGRASRGSQIIGQATDEDGNPIQGTNLWIGSDVQAYSAGGEVLVFGPEQMERPGDPQSAVKPGEKPLYSIPASEIGKGPLEAIQAASAQVATTGIKNKAVAKELAEMGLPPVEKGERKKDIQLHAEAKEVFEKDQRSGERLVAELERSPRPTTDAEGALLTFEANRLRNERKAAEEAFIDDPSEANKARVDKAIADYRRAADVFDAVGTQSGRGLRARQLMLKEDYSLAAMERAVSVAKGGQELTVEESAKVKELSEKIEKLTKEHAEYVSAAELRQAEAEADRALVRLQGKAKGLGRRSKRKAEIEQTKKELGETLDELGRHFGSKAAAGLGALDARTLALTVKAAAQTIKLGGQTLAQWTDAMVSKFGEGIRPYLRPAWDEGSVERRKELGKAMAGKTEPEEIHRGIQGIALSFVEGGITDRNALVKAVHGVIKDTHPNMTLEETRDAISGYGIFRPLSKSEAKAQLRDIKGQLQQVSKIEALQQKQPVKKTGFERAKPSAEQKTLEKRVRGLKRFQGLKPVDLVKAKEQAVESVKSRLRSDINSLEEQIDSGQKKVKGAPVAEDAELKSMREYRDQLKEQYDQLFPKAAVKRQLTDDQRIEMAIRATQRSLADLEQRLKTGNLARPTVTPGPTSPQLDALRAERDARRAELEFLRSVNNPKASKEELALKAYKARLTKQEEKIRQQITFGQFDTEPKKKVVPDKEAIRIKANLEATKSQFELERRRHELASMSKGKKLARIVHRLIRTPPHLIASIDLGAMLQQGGFFTFAHPIEAFTQHLPRSLDAMRSEDAARKQQARIQNHPLYGLAVASKLPLMNWEGGTLSQREENLAESFAENIPGVGRGVKASNRQFTTFMNDQRFTNFVRQVLAHGKDITPEIARKIASDIGTVTGRGAVGTGKFARAVDFLSSIFWSPRKNIGNVQTLLGTPLYRKGNRKQMAAEYVRFVMGAAGLLSLAYMAAKTFDEDEDEVKVTGNPLATEFGKLRVGDTTYDFFGGKAQWVTFMLRHLANMATTSEGRTYSMQRTAKDHKYTDNDITDITKTMFRSKLTPTLGAYVDWRTGMNARGEEVTGKDALLGLVLPMSPRDIWDAFRKHGVSRASAESVISILGGTVNIYNKKRRRK